MTMMMTTTRSRSGDYRTLLAELDLDDKSRAN